MAITVPAAGQPVSASTFGIPVANQLNGIAPTAWTAVTFSNGWTATAGMGFAYRKSGDRVEFKGGITPGTLGSAAFTLPAGFRPIADLVIGFPSTGGGNTPGHAVMAATGILTVWSGAATGSVAFTGVSFTTT
jgi:hypothetical protein